MKLLGKILLTSHLEDATITGGAYIINRFFSDYGGDGYVTN